MDIEEVRTYALSLHKAVTEDIFADHWLSFRICGKWFLLMQLDAPDSRIAVKLPPDLAEQYRSEMEGVTPAYHMNKKHWSDLYLDSLSSQFVRMCIRTSFHTVVEKLSKKERIALGLT